MPVICPTITAYDEAGYKAQVEKIAKLVHRIHIDLTDGHFAPAKTVGPDQAWWPAGFSADIHLMYDQPLAAVTELIKHNPNLIIIHSESDADVEEMVRLCQDHKIKFGLALLSKTGAEAARKYVKYLDHVMIFSGNLGHQGGSIADLSLLDKAQELKKLDPGLEIGWDGGVNDQNISELINGGVDVLDVGGYIQTADDPAKAIETLQRIADETNET